MKAMTLNDVHELSNRAGYEEMMNGFLQKLPLKKKDVENLCVRFLNQVEKEKPEYYSNFEPHSLMVNDMLQPIFLNILLAEIAQNRRYTLKDALIPLRRGVIEYWFAKNYKAEEADIPVKELNNLFSAHVVLNHRHWFNEFYPYAQHQGNTGNWKNDLEGFMVEFIIKSRKDSV